MLVLYKFVCMCMLNFLVGPSCSFCLDLLWRCAAFIFCYSVWFSCEWFQLQYAHSYNCTLKLDCVQFLFLLKYMYVNSWVCELDNMFFPEFGSNCSEGFFLSCEIWRFWLDEFGSNCCWGIFLFGVFWFGLPCFMVRREY